MVINNSCTEWKKNIFFFKFALTLLSKLNSIFSVVCFFVESFWFFLSSFVRKLVCTSEIGVLVILIVVVVVVVVAVVVIVEEGVIDYAKKESPTQWYSFCNSTVLAGLIQKA